MGEGSGAASIMHLLTSRSESKSLIRSAIIQSPTLFPSPNETMASQTYRQFLKWAEAENLDGLLRKDARRRILLWGMAALVGLQEQAEGRDRIE